MEYLEQFRSQSLVSAQDVYDLMKGSIENLERQMSTNSSQILKINDMIQNIKGTLMLVAPIKPRSSSLGMATQLT
jgi:wobble nucleotide-excising tRNase